MTDIRQDILARIGGYFAKPLSGSAASPLSSSLAALLFTGTLAALITGILPPFWQTNDDLGMAMMVDGYGLAAYASPAIIYSNILYGYIINALPYIADISRYSLVSIVLNVAAIFSICRSLCLLSGNILIAFSITALAAPFILVLPQFTVLAGALSTAGILHVLLYFDRKMTIELALAGGFLFLGYLIRSQEFYLVLLVGVPALPLRALIRDRRTMILVVVMAVLVLAAMVADWRYYQTPEWRTFRETNLLRAPLTDFSIASYILSHRELLKGTPYSPNDIALIGSWFLADPSMLNPKNLSELLSRVQLPAFAATNFPNAYETLLSLGRPPLAFVFGPAVAAGILGKDRLRIGLSWIMLIAIIVSLSLVGRSGDALVRVLYPPLLLLLCLAAIQIRQLPLRWLLIGVTCLASLGALNGLLKRHAALVQAHGVAARDLAAIDKSKLHVLWGADVHLESIYPVLGSLALAREFRWYGLGVASLAPFAMAHWNGASGGLPDRLLNGEPIPFFASQSNIRHLSVYCEERHLAKFRIVSVQERRIGTIYTVSCRRE